MVDKVAKEGQSGQPDADRKDSPEVTDPPKTKSLSDLLAEWDEQDKGGSGKSEPKGDPKGEPKESADDLAKRVEQLETSQVRRSYENDMKSVVATVKGDLDVDDFIGESWVNRKADSDPRLVKLCEERDTKKSQFDEAVKALAPEFQEYAKSRIAPVKPKEDEVDEGKDKPDKGLAAAVRNSREASPSTGFDDMNLSSLSERDFALKKAEVFRAARAGQLK